jgi:hypothetical protein
MTRLQSLRPPRLAATWNTACAPSLGTFWCTHPSRGTETTRNGASRARIESHPRSDPRGYPPSPASLGETSGGARTSLMSTHGALSHSMSPLLHAAALARTTTTTASARKRRASIAELTPSAGGRSLLASPRCPRRRARRRQAPRRTAPCRWRRRRRPRRRCPSEEAHRRRRPP